jgi:hypothetical protein
VADERLSETVLGHLEALIAAATPGPWEALIEEREPLGGCSFISMGGFDDALPDMYVFHEDKIAPVADLDFIAAAREYMPLLISEIRRLRDSSAE